VIEPLQCPQQRSATHQAVLGIQGYPSRRQATDIAIGLGAGGFAGGCHRCAAGAERPEAAPEGRDGRGYFVDPRESDVRDHQHVHRHPACRCGHSETGTRA